MQTRRQKSKTGAVTPPPTPSTSTVSSHAAESSQAVQDYDEAGQMVVDPTAPVGTTNTSQDDTDMQLDDESPTAKRIDKGKEKATGEEEVENEGGEKGETSQTGQEARDDASDQPERTPIEEVNWLVECGKYWGIARFEDIPARTTMVISSTARNSLGDWGKRHDFKVDNLRYRLAPCEQCDSRHVPCIDMKETSGKCRTCSKRHMPCSHQFDPPVRRDVKLSSTTDEPRPGEDSYNTWFRRKDEDGSVEDAEQGSSKPSKPSKLSKPSKTRLAYDLTDANLGRYNVGALLQVAVRRVVRDESDGKDEERTKLEEKVKALEARVGKLEADLKSEKRKRRVLGDRVDDLKARQREESDERGSSAEDSEEEGPARKKARTGKS
ncbi:hypothetical protein DL96DRAFT_1718946 [Flagelloscypha sp. PMI_526]|nr:hypothetical protein DL96DRAFT_1718946 [Flagelloscypha sp. PMI_526]